jgi:glucose-6-phosphate 1-dehydrogenase
MPDLREGCMTGKPSEDTTRADALVLFGAMGDLAHKKIFPALYHEAAWATVEPILDNADALHSYEPGSWGPHEADRLATDVGGWHNPE